MRNTITRTITTTTINAAVITFENGNYLAHEKAPITVHGTVNESDALKIARKHYGKACNLIIKSLDTTETFYEISVADFIKYAHIVEKPTAGDEE